MLVKRGTARVKYVFQEHNTMSLAGLKPGLLAPESRGHHASHKLNFRFHIKLFMCFKMHVMMGFLVCCCCSLNCFNWMPILFKLCFFFLSAVVALVHWFIWLCWTHAWMMKTFKLWRFDLLTFLYLYLVMNVCSEHLRYCFCLSNLHTFTCDVYLQKLISHHCIMSI